MAFFLDGYGGCCACTREKCSDECSTYRRYKPIPATNYDRIISKTPEELAEWIVHKTEGNGFDGYEAHVKAWFDWLKQEADKKETED